MGDVSQFAVEMNDLTDEVRYFFPDHPPEDHLHIIVQLPRACK
jgi:hypothetical protein